MLKIIFAVLLVTSLIVIGSVLYVKSFYTWAPVIVNNPLEKKKNRACNVLQNKSTKRV